MLYQHLQLGEGALCASMQLLDSIGLSINSGLPSGVCCATDCSPLIPNYSSSFQSTSLCPHLLAPQAVVQGCAREQHPAVSIAQHRLGSFPSRAALLHLVLPCKPVPKDIPLMSPVCIAFVFPTDQALALPAVPSVPCHFWCKAWLTSLSTDTFAPYSQIDPVPRVFIFYSGRKKIQKSVF